MEAIEGWDPATVSPGEFNVPKQLRRYARRFNIWLSDHDFDRLTEFCIYEWGGAPPDEENLHRDLFSAYLHLIDRPEVGRRVERSPPLRGKYLKQMKAFFEGGVSEAPPGNIPPIRETVTIPYEEFKCPRCGTVCVGDLPIIDHFLYHFQKIGFGEVVIRELNDYRGLGPEEKLRAYNVAKRYFRRR